MSGSEEFDVVVLGALGIDTNIYFPNGEIDFNVEANFSENLDYIGQAGGYSARAYNRLGFKTAFIGFIGNDPLGNFIKEQFKKGGIDISCMMIDPKGTKRSVNLMYRNGNRKNFYDGKGSMMVEPDFVKCSEIIKKTKFVCQYCQLDALSASHAKG